MKILYILLAIFGVCAVKPQANAQKFTIGPSIGALQQPSSNYFHYISGGFLTLRPTKYDFYLYGHYWQRPLFADRGFSDQEFFAIAAFGTTVKQFSMGKIQASIGIGKMSGIIETTHTQLDVLSHKRSYLLNGIALGLETMCTFSWFEFGVGYFSLTGLQKHELVEFVGWPYSILSLRTGIVL